MSDAFLTDLRRRFRLRCGEDLAMLRMMRQAPADLASPEFGVLVHRLSGAAGSFGYDELSRLARVIDDMLTLKTAPGADDLDRLQVALEVTFDDRDPV